MYDTVRKECIVYSDSLHRGSSLPPHLHIILWKSYIFGKYYAKDYDFGAIPQILYNWPYEELNFKNLMPRLPSTPDHWQDRDEIGFCHYQENINNHEEFCVRLIEEILKFFQMSLKIAYQNSTTRN